MEDAGERLLQFEDQEDRACDRECAKRERADARRVEARENAKAKEQKHRPRDNHPDQRPGNRARKLQGHEQPSLLKGLGARGHGRYQLCLNRRMRGE